MMIKYELIKERNRHYNLDKINLLQKIISRLKGMSNNPVDQDKDYEDLTDYEQLITDTNQQLKGHRKELLKELTHTSYKKYIKVSSDKAWEIFDELIDPETGRTQYLDKQQIKIESKIEYQLKQSLKEAVEEAKNEALESIRYLRGKRKNIQTMEKPYTPKGFQGDIPVTPYYDVAVSSGISEPCTKVYNDVWREYSTQIKYDVPAVNNNFNMHLKGGTFLELQKVAEIYKIFEEKKPKTKDHHVGVEIEFISKHDKCRIAQNLINENVQEFVYLDEDGSLRPEGDYPHGHEIAILAPEHKIESVTEKVLRAINKDGGSKVNWRCGLHVHIDVRNRDKELVFYNFIKSQRIMFDMNPRSRLDGTTASGKVDEVYSKKMTATDWEEAIKECNAYGEKMNKTKHNDVDYSRYFGVNPKAFDRHNTIEIRIHSGSTNLKKVNNWLQILMAVANLTKRLELEPAKPETFCKHVGLDTDIMEYIKTRIEKFRDKDGKHITVEEVA